MDGQTHVLDKKTLEPTKPYQKSKSKPENGEKDEQITLGIRRHDRGDKKPHATDNPYCKKR